MNASVPRPNLALSADAAVEPTVRPRFVELSESAWEGRMHTSLEYWQQAAEDMPSTPDAGALIELLSAPSDLMIRQLPAAARDALALCDDPSISRNSLATGLGQDPSLVQALLRTANSAAMNAGSQAVLRVDNALERLGVVTARSIVLANCVDGLLSRPGVPYESMVTEVWAHMIRTGQTAKVTARCFNVDVEEAFSVALLHDVGKLLVLDQLSSLRVKLRRSATVPMAFLHSLVQGVHEPLGALAAFRWGMGSRAANAIGTHHRRDAAGPPNSLAESVYAAERVDHLMRRGEPLELAEVWTSGQLSGSFASASDMLMVHYKAA